MVADGRHKLMPLLCVFHHPKDKEIEFFDLVNKVSYPEEVKQLYLKTQLLQVQFLATETSLKTMKNAFYITSKALFVLNIFRFLS